MSEREHISWIGQTKVFTGKCFRAFTSEKQWKNFISSAIIIILISMVTGSDMFTQYQATRQGSFAIVCACIWIGLFNSIQSICRERKIIKREHRSGVRISSYLTAHVIYEAFLSIIESLIVLIATYIRNFDNFPDMEGIITITFFDFLITLFLIIFASDMMSLLISCLVRTESAAMTVMPFVLIVELVMSGALFYLEGVTEIISYFTVSKWGLYAMCSLARVEDYSNGMMEEGMKSLPEYLLKDWGIILLIALACYIFAIVALAQVDKDKRQ